MNIYIYYEKCSFACVFCSAGVQFIWDCCCESVKKTLKSAGSGCILAHCMGLGKTLQVKYYGPNRFHSSTYLLGERREFPLMVEGDSDLNGQQIIGQKISYFDLFVSFLKPLKRPIFCHFGLGRFFFV